MRSYFMVVKKLLFVWLSILFVQNSWAQTSCDSCVYISVTDGCVPLKVKAKACGAEVGVPAYAYGDSPVRDFVPYDTVHTYTDTGVFIVTQQANYFCPSLRSRWKKSGPIRVRSLVAPKLASYPCSNAKVRLVNIDTHYDSVIVFNPAGTVQIPQGGFTYLNFGDTLSKTLDIKGEYSGLHCGGTSTVSIQSYSTLHAPLVYSLITSGPTQIILRFKAEKYHRYEIRMRSGFTGTYVPIDTVQDQIGTIAYPINNLNTFSNAYCFQIRAFDYCTAEILSSDFCSLALSGTAQNKQNNLKWSDYPTVSANSLILLINNDGPSLSFPSRPSPLSYSDTNILCGKQYCYRIKIPLGTAFVLSDSVCLTAVSNTIPPAVQDLQSTITSNHAVLTWIPSPASPSSYSIYSSQSLSTFSLLTMAPSSPFVNALQDPSASSYCYKINYKDGCGNEAPMSSTTCPVYLAGQSLGTVSRAMTWTSYSGWEDGVKEYIVEKVDENGTPYFSKSAGVGFSYSDSLLDTTQQTIYFRVKAVSNSGKESYSNIFKSQQEGKIFMPNAFTPNGDGLNDIFHAEGLFVAEFSLQIWNRNGEGMFSSQSVYKGWDGTVNGQKAPADAYMYQVEAKDRLGKKLKSMSGTVQLIR